MFEKFRAEWRRGRALKTLKPGERQYWEWDSKTEAGTLCAYLRFDAGRRRPDADVLRDLGEGSRTGHLCRYPAGRSQGRARAEGSLCLRRHRRRPGDRRRFQQAAVHGPANSPASERGAERRVRPRSLPACSRGRSIGFAGRFVKEREEMHAWLIAALVVSWVIVAVLAGLLFMMVKQHGELILYQQDLDIRLEKGAYQTGRNVEGAIRDREEEQGQPDFSGLPVGTEAPAFALADLDGQEKTLDDYLGSPFVVGFFNTDVRLLQGSLAPARQAPQEEPSARPDLARRPRREPDDGERATSGRATSSSRRSGTWPRSSSRRVRRPATSSAPTAGSPASRRSAARRCWSCSRWSRRSRSRARTATRPTSTGTATDRGRSRRR